MSVAVVIPWEGGCAHREKALEWVLSRYAEDHPHWVVELAERPTNPGRTRTWIKAEAVMPAVAASSAETVVVADADVWTDGIRAAVERVQEKGQWAVPHETVFRLSERSTAQLLAGEDASREDLARRAYTGRPAGGVLVAPRETLLEVPLDPRFVGWGAEDNSWAIALDALAGPHWRGRADLVHLWHPLQEKLLPHFGSVANRALHRRYRRARDEPAAMRKLIREAREELHGAVDQTSESPGHDRQAQRV